MLSYYCNNDWNSSFCPYLGGDDRIRKQAEQEAQEEQQKSTDTSDGGDVHGEGYASGGVSSDFVSGVGKVAIILMGGLLLVFFLLRIFSNWNSKIMESLADKGVLKSKYTYTITTDIPGNALDDYSLAFTALDDEGKIQSYSKGFNKAAASGGARFI